jgi:hypothetical protein
MNYSRRSFLRDSAVLSVAAALRIQPSFAACQARSVGVRVFFAGSWLFCHDPASKASSPTMLAVTLDPSQSATDPMDLPHTFPHGVWQEPADNASDGFFNDNNPSLAPCALTSPYNLAIDNITGGLANVNALFDQTNQVSRFVYLTAQPRQPYAVQDPGGLRVIRLPIPASIIPAAYRTDATIVGTTSVLQPSGDKTTGIATTHIFQYPNATSLTFDSERTIGVPSSAGFLDYHFHTVGKSASDMPPHAPRMFQRLLGLLTPSVQISLQTSGAENVSPGPCALASISQREQEVPQAEMARMAKKGKKSQMLQKAGKTKKAQNGSPEIRPMLSLATCDSGGVGVGCPPDGC